MASPELHALRIAKNWPQAETLLKSNLANDPTDSELWFCLSEAVANQNKYDEAVHCAAQAVALDPLRYQCWAFLANANAGLGNWEAVQVAAARALELAPELPHAHWLLGHAAMARGHWATAWSHLEYGQLCDRRYQRCIPAKGWRGEDIKGKTLFVWGEQGAGDVIQYARFLPILKERTGANIVFECRASLMQMLGGLADMVVAEQFDKTCTFAYDVHCALMSVPHILGLDTIDIDGRPYIEVNPREDTKDKIGLFYKGAAIHANDLNRSIPDDLLAEFNGITDFVTIQPGIETPIWLPNIPVSDFASTAAAIKGMKTVVTVDTSTAHVAGALGVPTILIAPLRHTEARWGTNPTTPWYDSWRIVHGQTFEESISKAKELLSGI